MNPNSEFDEVNKVVPYRTQTGLEIGRLYQPPKVYGSGEDILDLNDSYKIQSALITDGASSRRYRSFDIGFAVGIVLWLTVILLLS
jgi:hypothetical protein